jgi:hypothetical protein
VQDQGPHADRSGKKIEAQFDVIVRPFRRHLAPENGKSQPAAPPEMSALAARGRRG